LSAPNGQRPIPVVFGCSRPALTPLERHFFKNANPFGFILFKRNCETPEQVQYLIRELRQTVGRDDVPILIDQEGGRVARLQPPHWSKQPPAQIFGAMYEKDAEWGMEAMQCSARIVANELSQLGITINCAPVLDLLIEGATSALGDRTISRKPAIVAALARGCAETYLSHGILPVIKHFPGHGRMTLDPHHLLPTIDASLAELESDDFVAFDLLKDLPLGMNSHAVFTHIDSQSAASLSPTVHELIRYKLGFDGLLFSDDITMKALNDAPPALATRALAAGSDVILHCNGELDEMEAIAAVLEPTKDESWARWQHALSMVETPSGHYNPAEDAERLDVLLGGLAYDDKSIG